MSRCRAVEGSKRKVDSPLGNSKMQRMDGAGPSTSNFGTQKRHSDVGLQTTLGGNGEGQNQRATHPNQFNERHTPGDNDHNEDYEDNNGERRPQRGAMTTMGTKSMSDIS